MKRLVVCSDGTLQGADPLPTNVVMIAQAVKPIAEREPKIPQLVFYDAGVGTENAWGALWGAAFGHGIDLNIIQCYQFLCWNYQPGDEIYLYGFSRGAFTVRSLAGLIRFFGGIFPRSDVNFVQSAYYWLYRRRDDEHNDSIEAVITQEKKRLEQSLAKLERHWLYRRLQPEKHRQAIEARTRELDTIMEIERRLTQIQAAKIQLLGCWDTVGSLGFPLIHPDSPLIRWINRDLLFHDVELNDDIEKVAHAVSIDEPRVVFSGEQYGEVACQNPRVTQVWFPGNHGSVGGGTNETLRLSAFTLLWMVEQTQQTGLELDVELLNSLYSIELDPELAKQPNSKQFPNYQARFATEETLSQLGERPRRIPDFIKWNDIHESAKLRLQDPGLKQPYCPPNLLQRFPEHCPPHCQVHDEIAPDATPTNSEE